MTDSKTCEPGKRLRKSYTRKNGKKVRSTCVKGDGTTRSSINCPPGTKFRASYKRHITSKIHREGYVKKLRSGKLARIFPKFSVKTVDKACVKDPKAVRIGPLKKGELKKYGYSYKLPEGERHIMLTKAIQELSPLNVFRKLDAVSKLSVHSNPPAAKVFTDDKNWVRSHFMH